MVEEFCKAHENDEALREFVEPLRAKAGEWQALTMALGKRAMADADEVGAAAYDFLVHSGYLALAYWWARSVAATEASLQYQACTNTKRETARFSLPRILPHTRSAERCVEQER